MTERIRVSATNLIRVKMPGGYLMALDRDRLAKGERVLTPFGGAIEFFEPARPSLAELGAKFENGSALCLTLPQEKLGDFERWFYLQKDREASPYFKIKRKLVEEEKVLTRLSFDQITSELLGRSQPSLELTDSVGQEELPTQRYLEIFAVKLVPEVQEQIDKALQSSNTNLVAVTTQEISAGYTADGQTMINPSLRPR